MKFKISKHAGIRNLFIYVVQELEENWKVSRSLSSFAVEFNKAFLHGHNELISITDAHHTVLILYACLSLHVSSSCFDCRQNICRLDPSTQPRTSR